FRDDVTGIGNRAQNDLWNEGDEDPHPIIGHHVIQTSPNADGGQIDRRELPVIRRVPVVAVKELPHRERVFRELRWSEVLLHIALRKMSALSVDPFERTLHDDTRIYLAKY